MDWSGIVLPVELANFRAKPIGSVVQLAWETTSEHNANYFTVEHSLDVMNFTPIGRVKAAGNATRRQSYAFVDDQSHRMTNYYRLQQVDTDGSKRYSKIIAARPDHLLPALTTYPNPSDGKTFGLQFNDIDTGSLQLVDFNGRKIDFQLIETPTGHVTLNPLVPLKTGLYFLHATGVKTARLVVN
ncbi:hypothetical protein GCM10028804_01080 [Larkinella terrae]